MELSDALAYFNVTPSDNPGDDLIAAARESARRRKTGPRATTVILTALRDNYGLTFAEIENASYDPATKTRISRATAERLVNRQET